MSAVSNFLVWPCMPKGYMPQVYTCGVFFPTFQFLLVTIPPVLRGLPVCVALPTQVQTCKKRTSGSDILNLATTLH